MSTVNLCFVIALAGYGLYACFRHKRTGQDEASPLPRP